MKKFFLYLFAILAVLGAIFAYILYTEGAFKTHEVVEKSDVKPFEMKCEAGKCAAGKCGSAK
jgi:hypothetical protein